MVYSKKGTPEKGGAMRMAAKERVIGLAAHVDAGKTTLSEAMLFLSGAVRRQGRVDRGDAFLDTEDMEKERGITIFSKQAMLTWNKTPLTLLDTPGHTDFSGETERALGVMDACVLLVSATDGVQGHTRTLWRLLREYRVPAFLFVNKMDAFRGDRGELMRRIAADLGDGAVDMEAPDGPEQIAMLDEGCLDVFLKEGSIPDARLQRLIRDRRLFPCYFGSALKNEGVGALLDALVRLCPETEYPREFAARVFKVARDRQGARLTFLRVTGGEMHTRDLLSLRSEDGEILWAEKAAELRRYSGKKYVPVPVAAAGEICCVVGLSRTAPGDGLGAGESRKASATQPCYACRLVILDGTDVHRALDYLRALEEEEPLLQVEYLAAKKEIRIHSMGEVYLEVLQRQCRDRFGMEVAFADQGVVYRETIENAVEGVGHYEPLRHYAEVHLMLSPGERGSGVTVSTALSTDDLALNWQRLILTHIREKQHLGVLTGSPITDVKITLVNGRAHLKHTEGGDFRQATYRAVRQGLMKAKSVLLEPYLSLELTLPEETLGRAMSDIRQMGGEFDAPEAAGEGTVLLRGRAPAAKCVSYGREVGVYTRGRGRFAAAFLAYLPCRDAEKVIAGIGYDPRADLDNPPDSVFCDHGAGIQVPWDEVESRMHLPLQKEIRESRAKEEAPRAVAPVRYGGTREEDEELLRIFERTYGPVKSRQLLSAPHPVSDGETPREKAAEKREILLVDGYNVIFAWEELKETAEESLDAARLQLMDLMCNYSGVTGSHVILVFDAYKVPGGAGSAEKYANIYVIYTRETQTADAYIEKTTYQAGPDANIRVATSDGPEQMIALGNRALRVSAREFRREVAQAQGSIREFLDRHSRFHGAPALEKAYKAAWKQKHGEKRDAP